MAAFIGGCAHSVVSVERALARPGFHAAERTEIFKHYIVEHLPATQPRSLHVYIEGDGLPWTNRYTIATDPTPHNALALGLMTEDPGASIYIGRPCYFARRLTSPDAKCAARYWTSDRYSPEVIASMRRVVEYYYRATHAGHLVLIGYSGGAVIATQIADALTVPVDLVTLSGNLDVAAWTTLHGYTPLSNSEDPYRDFVPRASIRHHHFAAANDTVVPPAVVAKFTDKYHLGLTIVPDADHACCWKKLWPGLLVRIERGEVDSVE